MEFLHSGAWPIIVLGGFAVGFLVGLTGVGAGSLMTPFLISGIGISPVLAVGTDLLFASITKASAAWRHHSLGNVNWPIVRWLAHGQPAGRRARAGVDLPRRARRPRARRHHPQGARGGPGRQRAVRCRLSAAEALRAWPPPIMQRSGDGASRADAGSSGSCSACSSR